MNDRRSGSERRQTERREVSLEVTEDRRTEDRRTEDRRFDDQARRQVMDRRVSQVPVEEDRRKGSRRAAEIEAKEAGEEAVPDWMEEALADAAKRSEEFPSMSPPSVNEKENEFLDMDQQEMLKQQRFHDYLIMAFVTVSMICLFVIIFWI